MSIQVTGERTVIKRCSCPLSQETQIHSFSYELSTSFTLCSRVTDEQIRRGPCSRACIVVGRPDENDSVNKDNCNNKVNSIKASQINLMRRSQSHICPKEMQSPWWPLFSEVVPPAYTQGRVCESWIHILSNTGCQLGFLPFNISS